MLAVSLCATMVLCTVPLHRGSHASEANDSGTILNVRFTYDTTKQIMETDTSWASFDLASRPCFRFSSYWNGHPMKAPLDVMIGGYSEKGSLWVLGGTVPVVWDDDVPDGDDTIAYEDWDRGEVFLTPAEIGSSLTWSPGSFDDVLCDQESGLTLATRPGSSVSVSGDGLHGWTLTRTAPGRAFLDLMVGNLKVGEVTVSESRFGCLETAVDVAGVAQRLQVHYPTGVLPADTSFSAEYVDDAHGDHNFFVQHVDPATGVELRHFYNLTLTSGGKTLSQLDGPVELWFEAIDGIDAPDSFISRVTENVDAKLSPTIYKDNYGVTWIKVLTDHFSPYALTDLLSEDEKAALGNGKNNVKTGDHAVQVAVTGLGMTLVLALGIMLRLITNRKNFKE